MADASDSKSDEGDLVWVQVPSPAYKKRAGHLMTCSLFICRRVLEPMFKVFAPLRAAQSRSPPDFVRPISCIKKER